MRAGGLYCTVPSLFSGPGSITKTPQLEILGV